LGKPLSLGVEKRPVFALACASTVQYAQTTPMTPPSPVIRVDFVTDQAHRVSV
jgi:hypothetical protein